jgi:hypothetical protein
MSAHPGPPFDGLFGCTMSSGGFRSTETRPECSDDQAGAGADLRASRSSGVAASPWAQVIDRTVISGFWRIFAGISVFSHNPTLFAAKSTAPVGIPGNIVLD